MTDYTPYYGALTQIVDNTTSYSTKDSTGTDFTFEVIPLNITESEINNALGKFTNKPVWFIRCKTELYPPDDKEINKALEDGVLIKLSMKCSVFDNYGFIHQIVFNKDASKYEIKMGNYYNHPQAVDIIPLSNRLIDFVKEIDNPKNILGFTNYSKLLFTKLLNDVEDLKEIVKTQNERMKVLEQK